MINKFKDAFAGLLDGFKDKSIMLQYGLAICAIIAGFVLKLTALEWVVVVICIGLVIMAEMFNSCIEELCDLYSRRYNDQIKFIKDVAAGAVFVISITSFIVAMIIFYQHLSGGSL